MTTRDPSSLAILSARIMRAYPSLSPFSCASLAEELASIERAQRRHAERCCSGEDGGYTKPGKIDGKDYVFKPGRAMASPCLVHDPEAEQRAGARIVMRIAKWRSHVSHCVVPAGVGAPDGSFYREDMAKIAGNIPVTLQGDPRGPVLLVRFPGESEASSV